MTKLRRTDLWKSVVEILGGMIFINVLSQNKQKTFTWKLDDITVADGVRSMQLTDGEVVLQLIVHVTKGEEGELVSVWMEWSSNRSDFLRFHYDQFLRVAGKQPVQLVKGKRQKSNKQIPKVPGREPKENTNE
jgi:hypothetical protein